MRINNSLLIIVMVVIVLGNNCYAQRMIRSTFVEQPNEPPKVFVLDTQQSDKYFLKPSNPFSWHSMPLNNLSTVNSKAVRQELELTNEQAVQFRKLERRFLEYADERLKIALEKVAEDESIPGKKKLIPATKITAELQIVLSRQGDEELKEMLVPTQFKRLNELRHQVNEKRLGTVEYLLTPELIKKLGITEDQKKQLRKTSQEVDDANRIQLLKTRGRNQDNILAVLDSVKKGTVKRALGEEVDWNE